MGDLKESAMTEKSDIKWVRALDASGNSIRISKEDLAQVLVGGLILAPVFIDAIDINPNLDITLTTSKFKTEIASRIKAAIQSTANNNYRIFHLRAAASANVLYEYNWNNPDYVIVPGREVSCLITAVSQWNGTAQLHFTGQLPGQIVDTIMENWVIQ